MSRILRTGTVAVARAGLTLFLALDLILSLSVLYLSFIGGGFLADDPPTSERVEDGGLAAALIVLCLATAAVLWLRNIRYRFQVLALTILSIILLNAAALAM